MKPAFALVYIHNGFNSSIDCQKSTLLASCVTGREAVRVGSRMRDPLVNLRHQFSEPFRGSCIQQPRMLTTRQGTLPTPVTRHATQDFTRVTRGAAATTRSRQSHGAGAACEYTFLTLSPRCPAAGALASRARSHDHFSTATFLLQCVCVW